MGSGDEKEQSEILKEMREIKQLLKRMVNLFEQYDTDVFESEEVQRELQGQRKNGWRR